MTMKRIGKFAAGALVLAGCMLYGCERREEALFTTDAGIAQAASQADDENTAEDGTSEADGSQVLRDGTDSSGSVTAENAQDKDASGNSGGSSTEGTEESTPSGTAAQTAEMQTKLYVHVCGAVVKPGVYALDAGDRVYQAVAAAGGFAEGASEAYVNQAMELVDGMRLYIPTEEEARDTLQEELLMEAEALRSAGSDAVNNGNVAGGASAAVNDGKVNLNTATKEELCTLSGIGEGKAQSILKYREEHGSFTTIEEVMQVEGIKEGLFQKIKDHIIV